VLLHQQSTVRTTRSPGRRCLNVTRICGRIAFRPVLEILQQKAPLRAGRSLDEATDAFMTIYGDSTYQLLTSERGWEPRHGHRVAV